MRGEADDECGWYWQGRHHLSRVVLELVFTWLKGVELARAGAVCRLWRQVAAEPVFWRLLFATHARLSRSAQLAWLDIGGKLVQSPLEYRLHRTVEAIISLSENRFQLGYNLLPYSNVTLTSQMKLLSLLFASFGFM